MKPGDIKKLTTDIIDSKTRKVLAKKGDEVIIMFISLPAIVVKAEDSFTVNQSQLECQ